MQQEFPEEVDRILGMRQMQKSSKYMDLLLNRSSELGMTDVATMETNNIYVGNGAFVVLVFTIKQESIEGYPGDADGSRGHAMSSLALIINEVMTDRYLHYAADVGGRMVCLLCFSLETPQSERLLGIQDSIIDSCKEIEALYKEKYKFNLFYVISQMHFGIDRIEHAYSQCRSVLEYFKFLQEPVPGEIFENDWNQIHNEHDENHVYKKITALAKQLAQVVISENNSDIRTAADAWFSYIFSIRPYALHFLHNRTVLFSTHFLSELVEADYTEPAYIDEKCFTAKILTQETKRQFCAYVEETITSLIDHAKRRRIFSVSKRIDEVKSFVDEHFTEDCLSVSSLADRFGMSQPLLSTHFKQYTGTGLSDYIHKLRIQMAQELISSNEFSLQEIANAVGYTCLVTMYRAFKKYEGMPPGQLRKKI